jgi:molecular chaperone GrpE
VENIRKRSEREREDTAKYAITRLARDMVAVGDNFQRAIEAVPAGAAETDPALKSFLDGMTLIERELINVLERHGIKRMEPLNEPFNPHIHQAVMELPRSDVPAGIVVQIFQAGYMIEDRVLRPAMVAVARGAPKAPVPAEPGAADAGSPANSNDVPPEPKAG